MTNPPDTSIANGSIFDYGALSQAADKMGENSVAFTAYVDGDDVPDLVWVNFEHRDVALSETLENPPLPAQMFYKSGFQKSGGVIDLSTNVQEIPISINDMDIYKLNNQRIDITGDQVTEFVHIGYSPAYITEPPCEDEYMSEKMAAEMGYSRSSGTPKVYPAEGYMRIVAPTDNTARYNHSDMNGDGIEDQKQREPMLPSMMIDELNTPDGFEANTQYTHTINPVIVK